MKEGEDYTISFANEAGAVDAPIDAGDYTMIITGKGRYTGTVEKNFTIAPKKVSGLKGGKKYYVKIRTFKTVGGRNYYSPWSKAKKVKTKK